MTQALPLFAACQPGVEPFLIAELEALGITADPVPGGATFEGDLEVLMRTCLWLGTASHVRIRLAQFLCRALGELERKASEFPWRDWLTPRVPLDLRATSRRSRVYHTGAIQERIHNAIAKGKRGDVVRTLGGGGPVALQSGKWKPYLEGVRRRAADAAGSAAKYGQENAALWAMAGLVTLILYLVWQHLLLGR